MAIKYIYNAQGTAVGFRNGNYIHEMTGQTIGQVSGTHVHKLSGPYVGELYQDMIVNQHLGNPGNRGSMNCGFPDVFDDLLR